ncbi:hypothetical protein R9X47_03900 [Wukongibacter baidiensis]|uniref:hypothetical protein n=1 Tax=Wukongibacter baidiensis TaxID=1723361 RepID=UPI003D7FD12B
MFFKKKKKALNQKEDKPVEEDLTQIMEKKSKEKKKIDNVSDELLAQAIKDLLSKE